MHYFFVDYENVKNLGLDGIETLSEEDTVIVFYSQNANTITFETHKKICASKANVVFERVNVGLKNALDFQLSSYVGYIIGKTEEYDAAYHLVTNDAALSVIGKFWGRKGKKFSVIEKISDLTDNSVLMPELPKNAAKKTEQSAEEMKPQEVKEGSKTEESRSEEAAASLETADVQGVKEEAEAEETVSENTNVTEKIISEEIVSAEAEEEVIPEDTVKIAEVSLVDEVSPKKKGGRKPKNPNKAKSSQIHDPELEMKLETVLDDKTEIPVIVKIIKQYKTKQGINNALMKQFPSQNNQRSGEIYKAIKPLLTDKKGK